MNTKTALNGPGLFQWHTPAWFCSLFFLTGSMIFGVIDFAHRAPEVAGIWLACFLISNAIGIWLWWRRDQFWPYPAVQALLLTALTFGSLAFVALYTLRPGLDFSVRPTGFYLWDLHWLRYLVMMIALITACHFMERTARKEQLRVKMRRGR